MGNGSDPLSESAPSYDELFADHPVNQQPPAGSSSAYTTVPQNEPNNNYDAHHSHDDEQHQPLDLEAGPLGADVTPLQPVGSKPHIHCEQCERILERRERHDREKHCCSMVGATFIMLFISAMILGIIAVSKRN